MFNEDITYEILSFDYCRNNFGHYSGFAMLPLHLALIANDKKYTYGGVCIAFRSSGKDHENSPHLGRFMKSLVYHDSDFFTTEETRFFLGTTKSATFRTEEEIESDRMKLLQEAEKGNHMFRSHARHLLRAIEYWKLRFNEKNDEWVKEFTDICWKDLMRMKFINGEISRGEYETGVIVSDDGYYTDDYMSDSDDEEEENFRRMDMHGDPIYED